MLGGVRDIIADHSPYGLFGNDSGGARGMRGVPTERVLRRIGSVLSDRIYIWR
jgi:hypothetical protein